MTVASLVASEHFQNYCLHPTVQSMQYWDYQLFQFPEQQAVFEEAKALVLSLAMQPSEEEVQAAFLDFKTIINKKQKETPTKLVALSTTQQPKQNRRVFMAGAATVILLLSISFWQLFLVPAKTVQLAANYGTVQTHLLPDGSKVILNANSTLTFKDNWTSNRPREVKLTGEAFFEIKKKSIAEPFIVQTNKGAIKVLGTSFNVRQRAQALEVALLEGRVELIVPKYPKIKMTPGELVKLEGNDFYERKMVDVDAFSAWRFQRIVFQEATITRVIQRLQEEFNWTVTVADKTLLQRKITATIPKNDPELLLKALSEIYDLKIEQLGNKIYLIK